jgi:hypothetical protein
MNNILLGGYEDNDYGIRAKLAGYELYISAKSLVRHKAHQVYKLNNNPSKQENTATENEKRWFVVHTYSGYEDAVAKSLKQRIESLAIEFGETYTILYSKYSGIEKTPEEIRLFLNKIQTRDMVWNFRDISWISPEQVRESCLFRSSSLARFDGKIALSKWLEELGVKRIIPVFICVHLCPIRC